MKRTNILKPTCVSIAIALSFFSTTTIAVDTTSPYVKKLTSNVIKEGKVRVIVNLISPKLPDSVTSMSDKRKDEYLSAAIAQTQSNVLDRLTASGESVKNLTKFKYTSQMALTVTKTGLNVLMFDPDVKQIHEDKLSEGNLGESVPNIFPSFQSSPYSGEQWAVAVLDTGIDKTHSAFGNRVIAEACFSTNEEDRFFPLCPNSQNEQIGQGAGVNCHSRIDLLTTALNREEGGGTSCNHGTAVAGIVAGNFGDMQGVALDASLIAIQVFTAVELDDNNIGARAFTSNIMKGLQHVYDLKDNHNIASVNLSIGGNGEISTEEQCRSLGAYNDLQPLIEKLRQANIATVIASGNQNFPNAVGEYACIESAITVGAVNNQDALYRTIATNPDGSPTGGTNRGSLLDLYAPGVQIFTAEAGGGIINTSGTSQAAPHVAGAWAVMKQSKPNATVDEIENAFKTTGKSITTEGNITRQRINIDEALDALEIPVEPQIIEPINQSILSDSTVTFLWEDVGAKQYILSVGTKTGGYTNDVFYQYFDGSTLSATVDNIPTDGSTIYVRLWTQDPSGQWHAVDSSYITSIIEGSDTDGDSILDNEDNCINHFNPEQQDTDNDDFGNQCDADLDNSGFVDYDDFIIFASVYGTNNPDSDLNSSGLVNYYDFTSFISLYNKKPGPSGRIQ